MKLLFICTHNRCRSILCEAIVNQRGRGLLQAASAGSAPAAFVHPLTLRYLTDRVITVCDSAAGEACPIWMGTVAKEHWGLPDPSRVESNVEAVRDAFMSVIDRIEGKVDEWVLAARSESHSDWA